MEFVYKLNKHKDYLEYIVQLETPELNYTYERVYIFDYHIRITHDYQLNNAHIGLINNGIKSLDTEFDLYRYFNNSKNRFNRFKTKFTNYFLKDIKVL